MDKQHPHTGATYRITLQSDGSFGIEVSIPDSLPTMITGFATEAAAEGWVAQHKQDIASGKPLSPRYGSKKR